MKSHVYCFCALGLGRPRSVSVKMAVFGDLAHLTKVSQSIIGYTSPHWSEKPSLLLMRPRIREAKKGFSQQSVFWERLAVSLRILCERLRKSTIIGEN